MYDTAHYCTKLQSGNRRIMLSQLQPTKHNFSKIGKYISNKLHHLHKSQSHTKIQTPHPRTTPNTHRHKQKNTPQSQHHSKSRSPIIKQPQYQPPVGAYRVNYSSVDKNIHQYNFNRSTPHFFNQKHHCQQTTSLCKEYPDGLLHKQKGFTQLGRMVGRSQIKGSIRKNMEDPHQTRFEVHHFPTLTTRYGGVNFDKMSPRTHCNQHLLQAAPQYDCNFEVNMKRLDSHIIPFGKQTSRDNLFKQVPTSQDFRYAEDKNPLLLDKTVAWSKQLPREADGLVPTYMDKTVNSRMAISLINLKTLQMNCSNIKQAPLRLQRKRVALNQHSLNSCQKQNCL